MDPRDFDRLARSAASGLSRRRILALFGGGASLVGAGVVQAQTGHGVSLAAPANPGAACILQLTATVRLGPSLKQRLTPKSAKAAELTAKLTITPDAHGAIANGVLELADGTKLAAIGQIVGTAINLRVTLAKNRVLILVGTAERPLDQCGGAVDGLLTGPQAGDLGDWHATASPALAATTGNGTAGASNGAGSTGAQGGSTAAMPTATTAPGGCPKGQTSCGGACIDTQTDPNHCGACGTACDASLVCASGACCLADEICNGACTDVLSDPNNCGACGTTCGANQTCAGGGCLTSCPDGQMDCGDGGCSDLSLDPLNCGACGTTCLPGGQGCVNGVCPNPCTAATMCDGVCVNVGSDPNNCGSCGNVCPDGQFCSQYNCIANCPDGTMLCGDSVCLPIGGDGNCTGACDACPNGNRCCGGACADTRSDPNNCNDCGMACGQNQTCVNAVCQ